MSISSYQTFLLAVVSEMEFTKILNRAFTHDVTAAILVFQKKETVAMLVSQTSHVEVKPFSFV